MNRKLIALSTIILVVVVIAAAGVIVLNSQPQAPQTNNSLTAKDDSMAPTIKQGATVKFDPAVNYTRVQNNDIIVFHQSHQAGTFIGRVMNVTDYGLILKGDNKPSVYLGYITEELYVGKVTQIINP